MTTKDFALRIFDTIFGIVALLHLLRIIIGTSVVIADWLLPMWINYIGTIGAGFLCGLFRWLTFSKEGDSAYYVTDRNSYK